MGIVTVEDRGFAVDGRPFVPWGANYFVPGTGWAPQLWGTFTPARAADDFARMRDLGVNVVRVFTTYRWFLASETAVNEEGLRRFEQMLAIAWRNGIRLHPAGPDHWEGEPDFMGGDPNYIHDTPLARARAVFWGELGRRFKDDERIFAYDLHNEPQVTAHAQLWAAWAPIARAHGWPERFEALPAKWDNPEGLVALESLRNRFGNAWLKREADILRATGTRTLLTCGFLPTVFPYSLWCGFHLDEPAKILDFLSFHYYPGNVVRADAFRRDLDKAALTAAYIASFGKPVFVGEYGQHGGHTEPFKASWGEVYPPSTEEESALWCHDFMLATAPFASGWLCWGTFDIPESTDISRYTGLLDHTGRVKAWGKLFREMVPRIAATRPAQGLPLHTLRREPLVARTANVASELDGWIQLRRAEGDFLLGEA
ncbi:MAG: cellulase family glycosylhydrolase [Anaerolineae bacterium]